MRRSPSVQRRARAPVRSQPTAQLYCRSASTRLPSAICARMTARCALSRTARRRRPRARPRSRRHIVPRARALSHNFSRACRRIWRKRSRSTTTHSSYQSGSSSPASRNSSSSSRRSPRPATIRFASAVSTRRSTATSGASDRCVAVARPADRRSGAAATAPYAGSRSRPPGWSRSTATRRRDTRWSIPRCSARNAISRCAPGGSVTCSPFVAQLEAAQQFHHRDSTPDFRLLPHPDRFPLIRQPRHTVRAAARRRNNRNCNV